ncbi:MAG: division/cell wall cluster transcriptional repressor MraZ [Candidatus Omnitrophica bacterium]|nr:division/cell wall cluster transcriptional repressor MraZ [Candidatus Omnitrophota bacterium]
MFYGEYEHAIDRKGRAIIPAKFRQALHANGVDTVFLTRGLDGCLFLFPEPEWRAVESRFKQIPFTKVEGRKFNRLFFSGAVEIELDRLGRLLIPKPLKEFAHIKQDLVVIGVSTRIELWAKAQWQEFSQASAQQFEDVAEKILLE